MSKPYLCKCGNLLNVDQIALGSPFECPTCGARQTLEPSDPSVLSSFTDSDGVYNMMLKKRLGDVQTLDVAVPIVDALTGVPDTISVRTHGEAPPDPPAVLGLSAGDTLGPYRIQRLLGRGGMGTVFEAFEISLERPVALKVLAEEHSRNKELIDRFQREARACGSLAHPNITHIYAIGKERGVHYFAMELIKGKTLAQILADQRVIKEEDAIDYLLQVARGLRVAKRKEIIHRDLKPSNLILSEHGLLKITDFGLAKVVTSPIDITATGVIIGTPLYMSPEQGKGEPLDHRSDIYSLGCTFYHLLCGSPPFHGDTGMSIIVRHITDEPRPLVERASHVGTRLAAVVHRMMLKNPLDRFQDYDQLIEALSAAAVPSSSRFETSHSRIVLTSENNEETSPADSMSLKQLSVADVNLELGRYAKALALYRRVLEDNPDLEIDLAFRMLRIHQEQGDEAEIDRLYRRILELTENPEERFFCRWKLLNRNYQGCLEALRATIGAQNEILSEVLPSEVRAKGLRQRLEDLSDLEKKLTRDCEGGILFVRKTGDLQIELD